MYRHFFKRAIDIVCALLALIVFCWLFGIVAILVKIKLGSPVLFKQVRPGKKDKNGSERLFKLCKFRTMTDQKDENGNLLPDSVRLTKFGAWLRNTSLDELPEAINILKGDMSVIGPRPLLVRDMVFMSADQRRRHDVRPGLSGLAQIRGRNTITWEGKLESDLEYIEHITFFGDAKIVLKTIGKFLKQEGITAEGEATATDLGDYLLSKGEVTENEYANKQEQAKELLKNA